MLLDLGGLLWEEITVTKLSSSSSSMLPAFWPASVPAPDEYLAAATAGHESIGQCIRHAVRASVIQSVHQPCRQGRHES